MWEIDWLISSTTIFLITPTITYWLRWKTSCSNRIVKPHRSNDQALFDFFPCRLLKHVTWELGHFWGHFVDRVHQQSLDWDLPLFFLALKIKLSCDIFRATANSRLMKQEGCSTRLREKCSLFYQWVRKSWNISFAWGFPLHSFLVSALRFSLLQTSESFVSLSGCNKSLPSRTACWLPSLPSEAWYASTVSPRMENIHQRQAVTQKGSQKQRKRHFMLFLKLHHIKNIKVTWGWFLIVLLTFQM